MDLSRPKQHRIHGFTLIEVMLVIVLIGLMASLLQFNIGRDKPEEMLHRASHQFAAIFDVASEYAMLNNVELGLVITDESYQYVGFNGERWVHIADHELLSNIKLPEGVILTLELDDLPLDEPALFDSTTFNIEQDDDEFGVEENKKITPKIYILSGGDITPFKLTFSFNEDIFLEQAIRFDVTGLYTPPLTVEGPLFDE